MSLRVTPPDAGGEPWADASVAMNPVIAQSAQDAKPRLLSIVASLFDIVLVRTCRTVPPRNGGPATVALTRQAVRNLSCRASHPRRCERAGGGVKSCEPPQDAAGIACREAVIGNRLRDDASRADRRSRSDGHARHDDCAAADPRIG